DFQPFVDGAAGRQGLELRGEDRLVGGLQAAVAGYVLGNVIALVHAMLDQRIAGQRADHVEAGDVGLEARAELRERLVVATRELDPAGLDEGARRHRTHPRNDAVATYRLA